jgi:hypothetical protein
MTHQKIATFWLVMIWHTIRNSWASRNRYTGQARHRASYLGSRNARPAMDLVYHLRNTRDLHGHAV